MRNRIGSSVTLRIAKLETFGSELLMTLQDNQAMSIQIGQKLSLFDSTKYYAIILTETSTTLFNDIAEV